MAGTLRRRQFRGEDPSIPYISLLRGSRPSPQCRRQTYRSAEPVSKSRFNVWPPMVTGQRYSESYCSGVAVTLPSAAAALISGGQATPNFWYAWYIRTGPGIKGFGTSSCTVKACFARRIGAADAKERMATAERVETSDGMLGKKKKD